MLKSISADANMLWNQRFQELKDYKKKHGDCNVPRNYERNPALGEWIHTQRKTRYDMSPERRIQLESVGFKWRKAAPNHALWNQRFQELKNYKKIHGDCNIAKRNKNNPQLGLWVQTQRSKRERMLEERKAKLNNIGFQWILDDNNVDKKTLHTLSRQEDNDSALIKELKSTLKSWVERLIEIKMKHFGGETTPSPAQLRVAELLRNSNASEYELVETMQVLNSELMTLEGRVVKSTIGVVSK